MSDKDQNELIALNEALLKPFDESLIELKDGKRFIGHEHIRDRVIYATRNQFDFAIESVEYRDDGAIRERTDRRTGETHTPLTCVVRGTLTIPGLGSRTEVGVQVIEHGAGEDAPYKGAVSDAFKRAAMAFGVGLRQLYMNAPPVQHATARATSQRPQTRQHEEKSAQEPAEPAEREILTDAQFDERVRQALATKNGTAYKALIEDAQDNLGRWIILVRNCQSESGLDFVVGAAERKGVSGELLDREIESRRNWLVAEEVAARQRAGL